MKKDLIITMEEECIECPMLSLETEDFNMFGITTDTIKDHHCKHLHFCKAVRKNWEKVKGLKEKEE